VQREEKKFLENAKKNNLPLVIIDNPLLFEMGGDKRVDGVIVVTAPLAVQRKRVLLREGMDAEKLDSILKRQYPDKKKRQKADFIIDTSLGMENAAKSVARIIQTIQTPNWKQTASQETGKRD
jgi:dephospho-CoA kinase